MQVELVAAARVFPFNINIIIDEKRRALRRRGICLSVFEMVQSVTKLAVMVSQKKRHIKNQYMLNGIGPSRK